MQFDHHTLGQRVLFGSGLAAENLAAATEGLGASRAMLIASRRDDTLTSRLTARLPIVLCWDEVRQHVPAENAERATAAALQAEADVLVVVGGGSATGLAKAVALSTAVPIIAVPTTFSGSEATNMWGMTKDGTKHTGLDDRVLPAAVIYDAELTRSMPYGLAVASGLNALAHAVDSLWAPKANPINQALALEGARALAAALRGIAAEADDLAAHEQALYGCYLSAVAFASAGSGLHHKICHVLGGTFDLPHAQTHATILPYVLALNAPAVPELARRLAEALAAGTEGPAPVDVAQAAVSALRQLHETVDAPSRLSDTGFTADGIPEAVSRVLDVAPASNPVPVAADNLSRLLEDALEGDLPTRPYCPAPTH